MRHSQKRLKKVIALVLTAVMVVGLCQTVPKFVVKAADGDVAFNASATFGEIVTKHDGVTVTAANTTKSSSFDGCSTAIQLDGGTNNVIYDGTTARALVEITASEASLQVSVPYYCASGKKVMVIATDTKIAKNEASACKPTKDEIVEIIAGAGTPATITIEPEVGKYYYLAGAGTNDFRIGDIIVEKVVAASTTITLENVDAENEFVSSIEVYLTDATNGAVFAVTSNTTEKLIQGHTYNLTTNSGRVEARVGDATSFVAGEANVTIGLYDVPEQKIYGAITGTPAGTVTSLSFVEMTTGKVVDAVIDGESYEVAKAAVGEYEAIASTTNGATTIDHVSVKKGEDSENEVYFTVTDSSAPVTYEPAGIGLLTTESGSISVRANDATAKTNTVFIVPVNVKSKVTIETYYEAYYEVDGQRYECTSKSTAETQKDTIEATSDVRITVVADASGAAKTSYFTSITVTPENKIDYKSEISIPEDYETFAEAIAAINNMDRTAGQRVTINLNKDLQEQVRMTAPDVTLKGNDHAISWYYGFQTDYYSVDAKGYYNEALARDRYYSNPASGSLWGGVFFVEANNFIAEDTTFINTYNYELTEAELTDIAGGALGALRLEEGADVRSYKLKERSNAFYISADNVECYNCKILSSQDTLGRNSSTNNNYHTYFNNCVIGGNTDYICGEFAAIFDNCELQWKTFPDDAKNNAKVGYIVAPKTSPYVFRNCVVTTEGIEGTDPVIGMYGRTWGASSNCSFINTETYGHINEESSWGEMNANDLTTAKFNEYNNTSFGKEFVVAKATDKSGNIVTTIGTTADKVADYIDTDTSNAKGTVLAGWAPVYYGEDKIETGVVDVIGDDDIVEDVEMSDDATFKTEDGFEIADGKVVIVVDDLTDEVAAEVKAAVEELGLSEDVVVEMVDIGLVIGSTVIKLTSGKLKVMLKAAALTSNENADLSNVKVYHYTATGELEDMNATCDDGLISFVADSLSPFVFVFAATTDDTPTDNTPADDTPTEEAPKTGDSAPITLLAILAMLSAMTFAGTAYYGKKKLVK